MHGSFCIFFGFFHQLFALVVGSLILSTIDHYKEKKNRFKNFLKAPKYIFDMANDLVSVDV